VDTGDDDEPVDADGDGFDSTVDCDDNDAAIHPDAVEVCNGVDDDCDGVYDPESQSWYVDSDGDGWGDDDEVRQDCEARPGEVAEGGDCDDTETDVHPDAPESCGDAVDSDCDGYDSSCVFAGETDLAKADVTLWSDIDNYGAAEYLAVGDVNGDGWPDLGLTTRSADAYNGGAYVAYGPFSATNTFEAQGDRITSVGTTAAKVGRSIAIADVNGDGYADLAVGAADQTCKEWVWFGPLDGDTDVQAADIERTGLVDTEAGHGSDLDDLNGDGVIDLIVGAYEHDQGGNDSGAVYIDYGPVSAGSANFEDTWDVLLYGESRTAYAGRYVRTGGDVDGDGLRDLLVAAPYASGGAPQSGAAYLVMGGVLGQLSLRDADAKFLGEATNDYAGEGQTMGDVDGDGLTDVIIGSYNSEEAQYAGAVYTVLGPATTTSNLSDADSILRGDTRQQQFGLGLSAADVDGDGVDDLLVGAKGDRQGGTNSGAGFLYWGPLASQGEPSTADASFIGANFGGAVGMSTLLADLDNNSIGDVILGAPNDSTGGTAAGAVHILFGF
jgi:Putative metal-binding motif/FG-GAP repeat